MDDEFFFRVDQLPTNEDVFEFVNSRTRYGKMSRSLALNNMASAVQNIWQIADVCPLTHYPIIKRGKKLLRELKHFLTQFKKNAQPKFFYPKTQQSESTKRKRRFPSTGRDTSKRSSSIKLNCKIVTWSAVLLCSAIYNKSFLFVRLVVIWQRPHRGLTVLKEGLIGHLSGLRGSTEGRLATWGSPLLSVMGIKTTPNYEILRCFLAIGTLYLLPS